MALPHNREGVKEILKTIEPLIVGKERSSSSCCCGTMQLSTAIANFIEPGGDLNPGGEINYWNWKVYMKSKDPSGNSWWCGISQFIPRAELEELFSKYFIKTKEENPYKLKIRSEERIAKNLPTALRISEKKESIFFEIDWGRDQRIAQDLYKIYTSDNYSKRKVLYGDPLYEKIIKLLRSIAPEVYLGGPPPELPFESTWRTDYVQVLKEIESDKYKEIYMGSFTTLWSGMTGKTSYLFLDISFFKKEE